MVRVAVQASSGAARFSVAVQAESIERALEIAKTQDLGRDPEVTFPINSEVYFAAKPVAVSGSARLGRSAAKPGGNSHLQDGEGWGLRLPSSIAEGPYGGGIGSGWRR
jgi:hypothetical protein